MSKPLGAGREIDAYCTKCRMDLGHRVVAMVGSQPKRVECQTCGSHHNYRPPQSERRKAGTRPPAPRETKAVRETHRSRAEAERRKEWEERVLGQAATSFTRFSVSQTFRPDQLILHKKFGEGYVAELLEDDKISIMFADGPRTLVHGKRK